MTEDKKPESNGPGKSNDRADRGSERGRGGRHSRFGPKRDDERPLPPRNNEEQQPDVNMVEEANEGGQHRGRRPPYRGRGGGPGGRGSQRDEHNFRDRDDARMQRTDDRINEKLANMGGSTYELSAKDNTETKFSSRSRLYVGNLVDVTDQEVNEMFKPFGEINECFVNAEKMFAFVRLDYRANAERAKRELDGTMRKGRPLKVRFAPVGAAIKVKNLTQWVTNELLEYAFSIFGEIERAQVMVDDRGNSLKEGIVEFARKPTALLALRRCAEGCFFLTSSLRPVVAEPFDVVDDADGFPEKSIVRKPADYMKAREVGPRFAAPNSFEFEYGSRWKQLHELFKQKEEALKRELKLEEEKLEAQMEYAHFEHETEMLREQLRKRELDRDRQKREWEMKERQAEEQRRMDEEVMRRHADDLSIRMHHQEDDIRRRQQENSMFMQMMEHQSPGDMFDGFGTMQLQGQSHKLASAAAGRMDLDQRTVVPPFVDPIKSEREFDAAVNIPGDPKLFMERTSRFEQGRDERGGTGGRWGHGHPVPEELGGPKRRRF